MIIEIKGVEFENKGAELMLHAVIDRVSQYWPQAEIALSPSAKSPFLKRSKTQAWQKLSIRKLYFDFNGLTYYFPTRLRTWLRKWGIVTEADIDMVIDASGFSYSDQWNPAMSIRHLSSEINRNAKHNKPYIFMPQAFGPFSDQSVQNNIDHSFRNAALINAREEDSFKHLSDIIGTPQNLQIFGDFTNALEGQVPDYFKDGQEKACIIPNKNMVNPRNTNKSWLNNYETMLIKAINIYQDLGLKPFFLNHEGIEDLELIKRINSSLKNKLEVIIEDDPIAVKGIITNSRAVLCSRFHGCVSALSNSIPCIGTSWSHKYERLYESYGVTQLLLKPDTKDDELATLIESSINIEPNLSALLKEKSIHYKCETEDLWQSIQSAASKYQA